MCGIIDLYITVIYFNLYLKKKAIKLEIRLGFPFSILIYFKINNDDLAVKIVADTNE